MPYENFPNYVDETPGKKYYCTCGESTNKPTAMVLMESYPKSLKLAKRNELLFATVVSPINRHCVMVPMQSYNYK